MRDLTHFEDPFRPIYEKWAIGAWLGAAAISALMASTAAYGGPIFHAFTWMCLGMAALRSWPAWKLYKTQRSMNGSGLTFMTRQELKALSEKKPGQLFLGYGFDWSQQQTQTAYTLTRYNPELMLPRKEGGMGHAWIHGMGASKEEPLFMPVEHAGTHTLIVGTTGAGKTRTFDVLIAQVIAMGYSVIIIDPKGDRDMCDAARLACEELGRANDFVYFHPAYPEISARIDPLKNFNRATELASRIASLIPSETGSDPFTAFSMMAVNKLCEALLFISEKPSLMLLRRLLEGGATQLMIKALETHFERVRPGRDASGNELPHGWINESKPYTARVQGKGEDALGQALIQYYREHIIGTHPNQTLNGLISSFEHDSSHFGKMVTSLMPVLTMLTSGAMGGLLSPDYDDPDDPRPITDLGRITRNGQVAYLGLDSLSDSMVASAIGALFLSDLTAVAGDRYNFGEKGEQVPVAIFVDESAEVINPPLVQLLNKGRGSGFSCFLATQTVSDITARLGSKDLALKVLGNINNVLALRCNDTGTQEYIAESFAETVVRRIEMGQSSKNEVNEPLTFSGTVTEKLAEETVPLVPAAMLSCVPNLEGFARVSAGRVFKWRMPILVSKPAAT
ncbi:MAG: hypothetical protein A2580_18270 [Hydrogenophilales bacterium RIFOXYD1_FULL_62_11]|nr:MAG: hypothetical protein A2580_18270 [Hydrogenophilales bacterium RIFOXYD1_FULL_62_11]